MERVFQSYDLTKELKSKTEFIGQYIDLCEEKDNLLNMGKKTLFWSVQFWEICFVSLFRANL